MSMGKVRKRESAEINEDLVALALRTSELVADAKQQDRSFIVYILEMAFVELQLSMNDKERATLDARMSPNKV